MISEISFARGSTSFWKSIVPWINNYVHAINLKHSSTIDEEIPMQERP